MDKSNKISVVINTRNAELYLQQVLDCVKGFDEVIVCDMESTDRTLNIARGFGCRIVTFPTKGHTIVEPAREFAIHEAFNPWVLVVDADELVTSRLRDYLYATINKDDAPAGIAIPRKNYFLGCFLHSSYPDYVLRFFRKDLTHWPPVIHCSPEVNGSVVRIPAGKKELALEHLANDSISDILRKSDNYSNYEVLRRLHKNYGIMALLGRPLFRFFKSYVFKFGFLDGLPGLVRAGMDAFYQYVLVAKIIEKRYRNND